MTKENLHDKLIKLLKKHDWFFECSDDQKQWANGVKEQKEIQELIKQLGSDGQLLYEKFKQI